MFPPYNSTLVVRNDVLEKAGPDLAKVVDQVNKGLTDEVMQELNARVDLDKKTPEAGGRRVPEGVRTGPVAREVAPSPPAGRALRLLSVPETIEPLRFEDGALLVLDQRALPGRGALAALRDPGRGGRLHPHAGRARRAGDRPRGRLRAGAAPARTGTAAAELLRSTRPTAVNLGLGARAGARGAHDPLARARELHARAGARRPRGWRELGAERFEPGDRALTHCNAGRAGHRRLRHRRRRAARGLGARPARAGLGGRDPAAAPGRAPDGLGARARRHPVPAWSPTRAPAR